MTRFSAMLLAALGLVLAALPAQARLWKPDAAAAARDYTMITKSRPDHSLVLVFWLAPPIAGTSPAVQALLDKYVIIAAAHGHLETGGTFSFDTTEPLQALDTDGKPLTQLQGDAVPPAVAGAITAMGGMMRQSVGALGQGMRFFVFESGDTLRACGDKGRLSIPYAGDTYTYDTPIQAAPSPKPPNCLPLRAALASKGGILRPGKDHVR